MLTLLIRLGTLPRVLRAQSRPVGMFHPWRRPHFPLAKLVPRMGREGENTYAFEVTVYLPGMRGQNGVLHAMESTYDALVVEVCKPCCDVRKLCD